MGTVTLFSDFLRHFVEGKNNGGRVSFQTKRAQQVSCLSIIIVYIVLCSEIYTTAPERLQALRDRRTNTAQDRSVELCKPVLDTRNFSPLFRANSSFCFRIHFLDPVSKPNFLETMALQGQLTNTPTSVAKLGTLEEKKVRQRPASRLPAPRPRVSSPPFSTAKNRP